MDAADFGPLHNSGGVLSLPDVRDNSSRWGSSGSMAAPIIVSIILPILLTWVIKRKTKKVKPAAVQAKVSGAAGYAVRNQRYLSLLETPWEGANTITAVFEQSCTENSAHNLLGTRVVKKRETIVGSGGRPFEKLTLGNYKWVTYGDAFQRVVNFSAGLVVIGLAKDERVAIFAETCAEWFIALQACFRRNATVVTIYASLGDEALVHSLNETEATTVICDGKQLNKLLEMRKQLEGLKRVVNIEDEDVKSKQTDGEFAIHSFTKVETLGKDNSVEPNLPQPSDVAVIMYTSGSTGLPKGVMMTHANIVATVAGVSTAVPNMSTKDVYLAYLPLAHILELIAEVFVCAAGASIGYGSPQTLTDTSNKVKKGTNGDATQLQPTLMTAVPAILDRVRDGVRKTVEAKGGVTKRLFDVAYNRRLAAMEGSWLGAVGPEKLFWDTLVFKKIRSVLGGRIRGVLSGGAPLSGDTQRFMNICFGAPVGQGYGLTETCACGTFSDWKDTSVGRVGPPVPSNYIKLVDWDEGGYRSSDSPMPRGEIVLGGPGVTLGYFKNEAKTNEVYKVDETGLRWFFTGDIGQLHPDGCLEIIDRKKDIVKLQHGEYVSLGKVEAVLAGSQYVDGVMIHADPFHSYTVALVVSKQGALESWAQSASLSFDGFTDLVEKKEATSEVQADISKVGKQGRLEKWEIPAKVKLLSEPWTPESGLVTAALKIKRENIKKRFGEDLKQLYA